MKTTLDIPTDLYRQAKVKAAMEGRRVKDLVSEGLIIILRGDGGMVAEAPPVSAYETMRDACGCAASGVPDLATNPKHMKGFGR